jgi:predicted Zn finger-like uncharacterized protein
MKVSCPHCGRDYLLPKTLIGPDGSRVRCPDCRTVWELRRTAVPPASPDPRARASALVTEWFDAHRIEVESSLARHQLWSRFGPELSRIYDRLRAELESSLGTQSLTPPEVASAFREALRAVAGVELPVADRS